MRAPEDTLIVSVMPTPEPHVPTDEIRRLMQADWGDITQGAAPLADSDRAARLYGIVADPYHRVAFAGRSNIQLLTICASGLLENREWDKAARLILRVDRLEREQQHDLALAVAHARADDGRRPIVTHPLHVTTGP